MSGSSSELRHSFLDFFHQQHGHALYPSAPIIPTDDPTLLFTSAGMVPFKDYFVGADTPAHRRVVSCQKCLRAGGKHNDLDQVGLTRRHHTFFEMLGNFSFGDYFKDEAISWSWEFLTKILGLDPQRLWITVYHTDEQAAVLWKKIAGLSDDRILRINTSDNFWSAGDTGPCGPCSEIFYDCGPNITGGLPGTDDADGDRYMEIWNLVFMQFDKKDPNHMSALPRPAIDTGMGLERLAAVVQGVYDNFDTDIFRTLIDASIQGVADTNTSHRMAHRVIADHIRSIGFLMAEGVVPSAEGCGYVLRRMIRRALRYVHGMNGPADHLARLLPALGNCMGQDYPELLSTQAFATSLLAQESERFMTLLDQGLHVLAQWMKRASSGAVFPGKEAFVLYDTMGFPIELTVEVLQEHGFTVDHQGFDVAMEAQKTLSRSASLTGGDGRALDKTVWNAWCRTIPASTYVGPDVVTEQTLISGVLNASEVPVQCLEKGEHGWVVLAHTPFYPEGGGQQGDWGTLATTTGVATVSDTIKRDSLILHHVEVTEGVLHHGDSATASINTTIRSRTAIHHSATHLLQAALRHILGPHVMQKGSKVGPDKLRFDFSHRGPLTTEEWVTVETLVNSWIMANSEVSAQWMEKTQALATGAMALFGETYASDVRVLQMGDVSKELCGGTHVARTGDIGLFKILSDTAVASGVRRIEAVAGLAALESVQQWHGQLKHLAALLKTSIPQLEEKVTSVLQQRSTPRTTGVSGPSLTSTWQAASLSPQQSTLWHTQISGDDWESVGPSLITEQLQRFAHDACLVTSRHNDTTRVMLSLGSQWAGGAHQASDVLKTTLAPLGWSGGGRHHRAQGGGKNLPDHDHIVNLIVNVLNQSDSAGV